MNASHLLTVIFFFFSLRHASACSDLVLKQESRQCLVIMLKNRVFNRVSICCGDCPVYVGCLAASLGSIHQKLHLTVLPHSLLTFFNPTFKFTNIPFIRVSLMAPLNELPAEILTYRGLWLKRVSHSPVSHSLYLASSSCSSFQTHCNLRNPKRLSGRWRRSLKHMPNVFWHLNNCPYRSLFSWSIPSPWRWNSFRYKQVIFVLYILFLPHRLIWSQFWLNK